MPHHRVAAVAFPPRSPPDAALDALSREMWARGAVVGGVLQRRGPPDASGRRPLWLRALRGGRAHRLDRPETRGGCGLDPDALDRAAAELREAVRAGCDLLLVARFGRREAAGGGMREAIGEAVRAEAPLLVGVRADLLAEWDAFLGAPCRRLPPLPEALAAWAEERVREPT